MRLVLDNTLSRTTGLPPEGLLEGLSTTTSDPVRNGDVIEVFLDVTDFSARHRSGHAARCAGDRRPDDGPADVPVGTGPGSRRESAYRSRAVRGTDDRLVAARRARPAHHGCLCMRCVTWRSDVGSWRRSPLRALLEAASREESTAALDEVRDAMQKANDSSTSLRRWSSSARTSRRALGGGKGQPGFGHNVGRRTPRCASSDPIDAAVRRRFGAAAAQQYEPRCLERPVLLAARTAAQAATRKLPRSPTLLRSRSPKRICIRTGSAGYPGTWSRTTSTGPPWSPLIPRILRARRQRATWSCCARPRRARSHMPWA